MQEQPETQNEARPSVLVVDDEEAVANVMGRGLSRAGYDAVVVHSGPDALERLSQRSFDVLLTDIHMPKMRGDELQRLARQKDPDLAVLLITAAQDTAGAVECLKEGVFDYVIKPAPLADVAARVNKALERRQLILDRRRLERENREHQADLERRVAEQAERIRKMFQHSLEALIQTLEAKDETTRNHSSRVAGLTTALAVRVCRKDSHWIARLRVAALFHDIGKIGISEAILNKPGRLEEEEMAEIGRHPAIGEAILRPLFEDPEMLAVVRSHHEQINGEGYPDGLVGEDIPLGARIVAVADSYDALTSARPYRPGISTNRALQILREGAGTQWDPMVVEALLAMAESGDLENIAPSEAVLDGEPSAEDASPSPDAPPASGADSGHGSSYGSWSRRPVIYAQSNLNEDGFDRLRTRVGGLIGRGEGKFILDMGQVGFLNPATVQMVYLLHLRVQETGGQMALRDVPDHVLVAFRNSGLSETLFFEQSPIRRPRRPSRYARNNRQTDDPTPGQELPHAA